MIQRAGPPSGAAVALPVVDRPRSESIAHPDRKPVPQPTAVLWASRPFPLRAGLRLMDSWR